MANRDRLAHLRYDAAGVELRADDRLLDAGPLDRRRQRLERGHHLAGEETHVRLGELDGHSAVTELGEIVVGADEVGEPEDLLENLMPD